jgi:N-acetylglucosaminyl-diphospho-decaprenol L-rhamnosyltransferase
MPTRVPNTSIPSVDIVIVNWNTGPQLRACLQSIAETDRSGFIIGRVAVVDNASADGSADALERGDLPLTVQHNEVNRGFAAACNQGARGATGDYLLFLNPDTALFEDSLARPVAYMQEASHAGVGICGVRLVGDRGESVVSCAQFPTLSTFVGEATGLNRLWPGVFHPHLLSADDCRTTGDVDQIIGAFFLVKRSVYDRLGGFDERFFVYFEEVDFSLRARQIGYRSVLLADVCAYHRGGLSSEQVKALRLFYSLRSRLLYGFKHYGWSKAVLLVVVTVGPEFVVRLTRAFARRSLIEAKDVMLGYATLIGYFGRRVLLPIRAMA